MHEAALMAGLMARITEIAAAEQARRVIAVTVRLGALSHFSPAHFRDHFALSAAGTVAEGARLEVSIATDTAAPDAQHVVLERIETED